MLAVVEEAAPLGRRGRVRATVAGSEDAFGSGGRLRACVHVQPLGREEAVLLDCGASALTGLGLRLRVAGRVIAYSGDTAWTDTLIELADRADLFVCEAYTSSRRVRYHMDLSTLRANLSRLRCARLLLTHPSPDLLAHRSELGLDLADDGTVIEL